MTQESPRQSVAVAAEAQLRSFAAFLEEAPPGAREKVSVQVEYHSQWSRWEIRLPQISLYCDSGSCGGTRFFDPTEKSTVVRHQSQQGPHHEFIEYWCRHCNESWKTFALLLETTAGQSQDLVAMKFGEDPPGVGPTPRVLQKLLGDQWSLYLQGRRAEIHGLGIGAFVYYRRTVEHVWQTVLARLIEVAKVDGYPERLASLTAAQGEHKFTHSMEAAKGAVPASLYVDGHNPFQTLYDVCGDGLHEYSDAECIKRARVIRLVLTRFAERAQSILSDDLEFRQAVGSLAGKTQ
jgi:hypothetical protein